MAIPPSEERARAAAIAEDLRRLDEQGDEDTRIFFAYQIARLEAADGAEEDEEETSVVAPLRAILRRLFHRRDCEDGRECEAS